MNTETHKYLCWLNQIRGLGRKRIFPLLQSAGESSLFNRTEPDGDCFPGPADWGEAARLLYTAPEPQLAFLCSEAIPPGKHAAQAAQLILRARKQDPARIEENLARTGIFFSCIIEESFPTRLRFIPDPPFGIYCRGPLLPPGPPPFPGLESPAAAVIGARLASGYGREQARRFSYRMASRGITIISGMARGIDGIAQTAALDAGGRSYAVLGCGVDICYPEENRSLYDRLLQQSGILSEYPPGTPPEARLFPLRNRIISGLADAVLVIEARKKSGTLITVDMALEQGRDVFALPGRVSDSLSDGCNRLIRQGAAPATCPEDLLEYFFETDTPAPETGKGRPAAAAGANLSGGNHESDKETAKEKGQTAAQGCKAGRPVRTENDDLPEGEKGSPGCSRGKDDLRENKLKSPGSHACPVLCAGRESSRSEPEEGREGSRNSPLCSDYRREPRYLKAGGGICLPEADGNEECEKKPDSLEEIEPAFMSDPPDETEPVNMFDPLEETAPEVKFNLPEETEPEIKYDSLAQMILEVLSPEDGMHLERILEQISSIPAERRTFAESFGLSVVIPCLLRLKMDGRVEETSAGYFRKTR
ncbi:MAG: DNA-protecting protein DprA [Sarcina sp.]|nr:DNA-protecting protein DprA [Sarcina sp.]